MNIEIFKNNDGDQRMSSLHIAEVVGKRHPDVLRVIRRLTDKGIIKSKPLVRVDGHGQDRPYFELDFTESVNVIAQMNPQFTARIIDRWQELERQVHALELEKKDKEIQLALEQSEKLRKAAEETAILRKKLAARLDPHNVRDIKSLSGIFGMPESVLRDKLMRMRWIYQEGLLEKKKNIRWRAVSSAVRKGFVAEREVLTRGGWMVKQAVITEKGYDFLCELWPTQQIGMDV